MYYRSPRPKYKPALKPRYRAALRKLGYTPKLFRLIKEKYDSITFEEVSTGKMLVIHK